MDAIRSAFELTCSDLDTCFDYQESVYQHAMMYFLQQEFGTSYVSKEVTIEYRLRDGHYVGHGRADLVVETPTDVFIIELKRWFCNFYRARSQVKRYMAHFPTHKRIRGFLCVFCVNPSCEEVQQTIS